MKITLPNGITIEGTEEEVRRVVKNQDKGMYLSESSGLIPIEDMETNHIMNALCKEIKKYTDSISRDDISEFLDGINDPDENEVMFALKNELENRLDD